MKEKDYNFIQSQCDHQIDTIELRIDALKQRPYSEKALENAIAEHEKWMEAKRRTIWAALADCTG